MSFLDRMLVFRQFQPENYRPWVIDGQVLGRIPHALAKRLEDFPGVFQVGAEAIHLVETLDTFDTRSDAVAGVIRRLVEAGDIAQWREESYAVTLRWDDPPALKIDRGAVPDFGVRGFGVHLNGLVERSDGLHIWVGKRALNKATAPGKLDHIVAGGQPYGLSIRANLIKECQEEASIPLDLAAKAIPVGAVSYRCERAEGLRDDVLFSYDLTLPEDFEPVNTDGEVETFSLWPLEQVIERVRETEDFKFNVAMVTIHLLIRRGVLGPDQPDYQAIVDAMWLND